MVTSRSAQLVFVMMLMTSADVMSLLLPPSLSLRKEGTSNEVEVRQIALPHSNNLPNPLVMFPSLASVSYLSREGPLSSPFLENCGECG